MTGTRLHRFDFGSLRDFRGPLVAKILPDEVDIVIPEPPPPPTFSEEELAAARAAGQRLGYSEGYEAGLARAAEQADAQRLEVETTILQMSQLLNALQQSYQQLLETESAALTQLVTLIAKKVAGESLQQHGIHTIEALVKQCLPVVLSKPRLNIELHTEGFAPAMDQIESLLQISGFEGEIQFRANPALAPHDVLLDWGSGQASRNTEKLWQEIEALLAAMPVTIAPLAVAYHIPPAPAPIETLIPAADLSAESHESPIIL